MARLAGWIDPLPHPARAAVQQLSAAKAGGGKEMVVRASGSIALCAYLVVAVGWCGRAAAEQAAAPGFTFTTPKEIVFTVGPDGLTSIRAGGRAVAEGAWSLFNAENWFKDAGSGLVKTASAAGGAAGGAGGRGAAQAKAASRSMEVLAADHVRVRQAGGDVEGVYDYRFQGEDVIISARVENRHAESPLNVCGFSGLTFLFDKLPEGLMPVQHISYFQAHGLGLCHPGYWSPIGGSYAADGTIGVGVSPANTGMIRTLILWDYADWNPGQREMVPKRKLIYFANQVVPPRGAATVDLVLRISPDRDWKHLLEPYKKHFQKTWGDVQYKADHRWIATDYLNHSQAAVSPTNPYGFHGGQRRIDTADGARLFCDTLIPRLRDGNGQGAIVWGQGGDDPRGGMYRPDFDVMPPEVLANWPMIAGRFREANLKLGVTTRPRHMAVRKDWKQDQIIDINPADPGHRQMLWNRFDTMKKLGCSLFYLDSFGDSLEDILLMRDLRARLGPDVLTFAEHQCDAMMVYSGGYSETTLSAEGNYRLWSGLDRWAIYQWLAPGCQMTARLYEIKGKPKAEAEAPDRFFLRNRITPLLPANDFSRAAALNGLQAEMISPEGAWVAPR